MGYVVGGRTTGGPIQDTYDTLAFFAARGLPRNFADGLRAVPRRAGRLEPLTVWGSSAKRAEAWGLAAFFSDVPAVPGLAGAGAQPSHESGERPPRQCQLLHAQGPCAGESREQPLRRHRRGILGPDRGRKPPRPRLASEVRRAGLSVPERGSHRCQHAAARASRLALDSDPQFARAAVNYIWRAFFSRGIVEPADQFDLARLDPGSPASPGWDVQPSHPQLLEWLAEGFRESGFDLKWLMREIVTSQTYPTVLALRGGFQPAARKVLRAASGQATDGRAGGRRAARGKQSVRALLQATIMALAPSCFCNAISRRQRVAVKKQPPEPQHARPDGRFHARRPRGNPAQRRGKPRSKHWA